MKAKARSTLVASGKPNPSTEDPVAAYHRLLLENNPHALTVIEDLLEETGLKLSDLSHQDAIDRNWVVSLNKPTKYGVFVLSTADPFADEVAVEWQWWHQRNGNTFFEISLYWYTKEHKYGVFHGDGSMEDAVTMAWEAVRVCRLYTGGVAVDGKDELDALLEDLEDELHAGPTRRMNPSKSRDEAQKEFEDLLLEHDANAISVAQDLLLESGLTLADVSQATLAAHDPVLVKALEAFTSRTPATGVQQIAASGVFVLNDNYEDFVQWTVKPRPDNAWRISWQAGINNETFDDRTDVPHPTNRRYTFDEAKRYASDYAWYMVKVIIKMFYDFGEAREVWEAILTKKWTNTELGVTPEEIRHAPGKRGGPDGAPPLEDNPATGKMTRQNPRLTRADIEQEFWTLLRSPTPDSISIAQDLLEEAGDITLADVSKADNYAGDIAANGFFSLGTEGAVVWSVRDERGGYNRQDGGLVVDGGWPFEVMIRQERFGESWRDAQAQEAQFGPEDYDDYERWRTEHPRGGLRVPSKEESIHLAVKLAWEWVKAIARTGPMANWRDIVLRTTEAPYTAPQIISPFGRRRNPAEETLKENPAWVTKHLADSWVTLESQVSAQWLPKLDRTASKGKRMSAEIPEYGCGAYGCVMPTNDPKIVLKLTTDDTEAEFAARLSKELPVPIVTKYEIVLNLPMAQRQGRKVYLLWREAADDVGNVDKVVGAAAEDAIDKQHKAAQLAFEALMQGDPAERELAAWTSAVKGMGKVPELKWLADGLLRAYHEKGIFFGDMHAGNLGRVRGQWVITDPGHVAVVKE